MRIRNWFITFELASMAEDVSFYTSIHSDCFIVPKLCELLEALKIYHLWEHMIWSSSITCILIVIAALLIVSIRNLAVNHSSCLFISWKILFLTFFHISPHLLVRVHLADRFDEIQLKTTM